MVSLNIERIIQNLAGFDLPQSGFIVYEHIDSTGSVLYVGSSECFTRRQEIHLRDSRWWSYVKEIHWMRCSDRDQMLRLEKATIESAFPEFNGITKSPGNVAGTI
jgi:excinuclease UvrABC nuclease subunit